MEGAVWIGRNVGSQPMSEIEWRTFVGDVQAVLRSCGATIYTVYYGAGSWDEVAEDSSLITFSDGDEDRLVGLLVLVARSYQQEAIGLLTGTMQLVCPTVEVEA